VIRRPSSFAYPAPVPPIISIQHLVKVYPGGTRALDDISLAIERGEFASAATTLADARAFAERSPARDHLTARTSAELARLALRTYKRPVQFAGVITQHWKGCRRRVCGMTPREAHSQLGKALKENPATADQVRQLAAVTNISAD
jgi:hypothetical protein